MLTNLCKMLLKQAIFKQRFSGRSSSIRIRLRCSSKTVSFHLGSFSTEQGHPRNLQFWLKISALFSPFQCLEFFLSPPPWQMTSMSITFVGSRCTSIPSITGTRRDRPRGQGPPRGRRVPGVHPALCATALVAVTQRRAMKRGKPMPPEQAETQPPPKKTRSSWKGCKTPNKFVADVFF